MTKITVDSIIRKLSRATNGDIDEALRDMTRVEPESKADAVKLAVLIGAFVVKREGLAGSISEFVWAVRHNNARITKAAIEEAIVYARERGELIAEAALYGVAGFFNPALLAVRPFYPDKYLATSPR